MKIYEVRIKRSAEKELDDLPPNIQDRILKRILSLGENPRPIGIRKLQGRKGYRIRVGDYRILYAINDAQKTVDILDIIGNKSVGWVSGLLIVLYMKKAYH